MRENARNEFGLTTYAPVATDSPRYYIATADGEAVTETLYTRDEASAIFRERAKLGTAERGERVVALPRTDPRIALRLRGVAISL